jgi:hypothetical protein
MFYAAYAEYQFLLIQLTLALHVLHQPRTSQEVFQQKQHSINAEDVSAGTLMQENGWHAI